MKTLLLTDDEFELLKITYDQSHEEWLRVAENNPIVRYLKWAEQNSYKFSTRELEAFNRVREMIEGSKQVMLSLKNKLDRARQVSQTDN